MVPWPGGSGAAPGFCIPASNVSDHLGVKVLYGLDLVFQNPAVPRLVRRLHVHEGQGRAGPGWPGWPPPCPGNWCPATRWRRVPVFAPNRSSTPRPRIRSTALMVNPVRPKRWSKVGSRGFGALAPQPDGISRGQALFAAGPVHRVVGQHRPGGLYQPGHRPAPVPPPPGTGPPAGPVWSWGGTLGASRGPWSQTSRCR